MTSIFNLIMSDIVISSCSCRDCPRSPIFNDKTGLECSGIFNDELNTSMRIAPVPLPNFDQHRNCFMGSWHCGEPQRIDMGTQQSLVNTPISRVHHQEINESIPTKESFPPTSKERRRITTNPRVKRASLFRLNHPKTSNSSTPR